MPNTGQIEGWNSNPNSIRSPLPWLDPVPSLVTQLIEGGEEPQLWKGLSHFKIIFREKKYAEKYAEKNTLIKNEKFSCM